jgi:L-Ala-D/L-Glu epimerase
MKLSFSPHTLEFKRPFSIAHGSRNSTPVVFTQIEQGGWVGYGEASMPPYLGESHSSVLHFLEKAKKVLIKFSNPNDLATILAEVDKLDLHHTAAKASIDIALHDLWGKHQNKPCHQLFHTGAEKEVHTAYTIPIDNEEGIAARIKEAEEYKLLKIKVGSADDKELIRIICRQTTQPFFVDANEAWADKNVALDMIQFLAEKKCLFVEQPMPKEQIDDIKWLCGQSPLPIIADEAVKRFSDLEKTVGSYHGINIKLMKSTGLHEAKRMMDFAKENNMKIMLGCMSESTCAVSAAAQLASLADWVDLDGPLLIKKDYFEGVQFVAGKIILNELPGIGVKPILA